MHDTELRPPQPSPSESPYLDRPRNFNTRDASWGPLTRNLELREKYLRQLENTIHVAGGGIPLLFGNQESKIWTAIVDTAHENGEQIEIAGINFSLSELELLGDFYRFSRDQKDLSFACVDDRLVVDADTPGHDPKTCSIHENCGAAGAINKAIELALNSLVSPDLPAAGTDGAAEAVKTRMLVEDLAVAELGQTAKLSLVEGMPRHQTSAILLTFGENGLAVKPEHFNEFLKDGALPMNVTIPLKLVKEFIVDAVGIKPGDSLRHKLLTTLFKWNVDIAKAVIGNKEQNDDSRENVLVIAYVPGSLGQQPFDVLHRYMIDENPKENPKEGSKEDSDENPDESPDEDIVVVKKNSDRYFIISAE